MSEPTMAQACTHACSYGCGRMYDCVFTQVIDASTLFLCMPCFMTFARNIMEAMVEADSAAVQEAVAGADLSDVMLVDAGAEDDFREYLATRTPDDQFDFDGSVVE